MTSSSLPSLLSTFVSALCTISISCGCTNHLEQRVVVGERMEVVGAENIISRCTRCEKLGSKWRQMTRWCWSSPGKWKVIHIFDLMASFCSPHTTLVGLDSSHFQFYRPPDWSHISNLTSEKENNKAREILGTEVVRTSVRCWVPGVAIQQWYKFSALISWKWMCNK